MLSKSRDLLNSNSMQEKRKRNFWRIRSTTLGGCNCKIQNTFLYKDWCFWYQWATSPCVFIPKYLYFQRFLRSQVLVLLVRHLAFDLVFRSLHLISLFLMGDYLVMYFRFSCLKLLTDALCEYHLLLEVSCNHSFLYKKLVNLSQLYTDCFNGSTSIFS